MSRWQARRAQPSATAVCYRHERETSRHTASTIVVLRPDDFLRCTESSSEQSLARQNAIHGLTKSVVSSLTGRFAAHNGYVDTFLASASSNSLYPKPARSAAVETPSTRISSSQSRSYVLQCMPFGFQGGGPPNGAGSAPSFLVVGFLRSQAYAARPTGISSSRNASATKYCELRQD